MVQPCTAVAIQMKVQNSHTEFGQLSHHISTKRSMMKMFLLLVYGAFKTYMTPVEILILKQFAELCDPYKNMEREPGRHSSQCMEEHAG